MSADADDSFWDILSALGDFFGGIFAGLALLVAAIAYKRQVDDKRREQAAKVVLRSRRDPDGALTIDLYNGSDEPITVLAGRAGASGIDSELSDLADSIKLGQLSAFDAITIVWDAFDLFPAGIDYAVFGSAEFDDVRGTRWQRNIGGSLQVVKKQRWWHRPTAFEDQRLACLRGWPARLRGRGGPDAS